MRKVPLQKKPVSRNSLTKPKKKRRRPRGTISLQRGIQKIFNQQIRDRDQIPNGTWKCISCDEIITKCNASHYFERKRYPRLAFDPMNVHASCTKCNLFLHGNLLEYRKRLKYKIGEEELNKLEERGFAPEAKIPFTEQELLKIKEKNKNK